MLCELMTRKILAEFARHFVFTALNHDNFISIFRNDSYTTDACLAVFRYCHSLEDRMQYISYNDSSNHINYYLI